MAPPIIGAYHVATFPGWEPIVAAQCARLIQSGLLARTEYVLVGIVGEFEPARSTIERLLGEKARIYPGGPVSNYEFGTLQLLHSAATEADCYCWYIHTKGVSDLCPNRASWRRRMESVVLDNHAACYELLNEHDACGPFWLMIGFDRPNPHFSGNFWWARSSYLRTLPRPVELHVANRYEAEFWIGKNPAIKVYNWILPSDPYAKPSAWVGLESKYQRLCEIEDPKMIQRAVEIGVDYGYSTFHMAHDFPHAEVYGVSEFLLHQDSEAWVRSHLDFFPNLQIIHGDSVTVGREFGKPIDLLHIDGDHSFEAVKADFENWVQWIRPGGRVMFHDTVTFPTVRAFFDGLPGRKTEIKDHHGLGCWFKET